MNLVLIRHGKAEKPFGQADAERTLTSEGIELLREGFPHLVSSLGPGPWVILSSPLIRARQTAALLNEAFIEADIYPQLEILPELAGTHTERLIEALCTRDAEEKAGLILVGHQPWLSIWTADLCGFDPGYTKGSASLIELPELRTLSPREWPSLLRKRHPLIRHAELKEFSTLPALPQGGSQDNPA